MWWWQSNGGLVQYPYYRWLSMFLNDACYPQLILTGYRTCIYLCYVVSMMMTRYVYILCWISEKNVLVFVIIVVNQKRECAAFHNNSCRLKKTNNFPMIVLYRCFVFWRRFHRSIRVLQTNSVSLLSFKLSLELNTNMCIFDSDR